MIVWLAMGATQVEAFPSEAACLKRLDEMRRGYERLYVIKASGCFPRELLAKASHAEITR